MGQQQKFDLPCKAKSYYEILIKKIQKRTYLEKYCNNIFHDKPGWSLVSLKRIKIQADNKMKDFHFKLLHKILPNQENLTQWKISTSKKCRFGCNIKEDQCHQFIECSRLRHLLQFVETIFAS